MWIFGNKQGETFFGTERFVYMKTCVYIYTSSLQFAYVATQKATQKVEKASVYVHRQWLYICVWK